MSVEVDRKLELKNGLQFQEREGYFSPPAINPTSPLFQSRHKRHHGHARSQSSLDEKASKGKAAIEIDSDISSWVHQHYTREFNRAIAEQKEQPATTVLEEKSADAKDAQGAQLVTRALTRALSLFVQFDEFNPDIQESSNTYERIFADKFSSTLNKNPKTKRDLFSPIDVRIAYRIHELLNNVLRSSQPQGFFSNVLQNNELKYDQTHIQNNFVDERTYIQVTDEVPYNICARMLNQLEVYITNFEAPKARANIYWWGRLLAWLLLVPALTIFLPILGWTLLWLSGVSKAEAMNEVISVVSPVFIGGWWSYLVYVVLSLSLIIGFIAALKAYANSLDATEQQIISANDVTSPLAAADVEAVAKKAIYGRVFSVLLEYMKQCGHLKTDDYIKIKLAELKEARTPRLEQELIDTLCRLHLTREQVRAIQAGDTENRIVPGCEQQTINWAVREFKYILHTIPDFFKELSEHKLSVKQIQQIKALVEAQLSNLRQIQRFSNMQTSQRLLAQEMRAYEAVLKNFDGTFHLLEALEQKELEGQINAFNSTKIDENTLHIIPDFFKELSEHKLSLQQIQQIKALAESNLMLLKQMRGLPNIQVRRPLLAQEIAAYEAVRKNFDKMFPVIDLEQQTLDDKIKYFKETKIKENRTHWWDIISRLRVWQITQAQIVGRAREIDAELGRDWLDGEVAALNVLMPPPVRQAPMRRHQFHRSRSSIDVARLAFASIPVDSASVSVSVSSTSKTAEPVVESKEEADADAPRVLSVTESSSSIDSSSVSTDVSMSSASTLTLSASSASVATAPRVVLVTREGDREPRSMTVAEYVKSVKSELKEGLGRIREEVHQDTIPEGNEEDEEDTEFSFDG